MPVGVLEPVVVNIGSDTLKEVCYVNLRHKTGKNRRYLCILAVLIVALIVSVTTIEYIVKSVI